MAYNGICTGDGKIVTEPVYTMATLLTDSHGNTAYLCYRSDLETSSEMIENNWGTYEQIVTPALLFATDGSWVMEFEGALPFYGSGPVVDVMCNADFLVVKKAGKWGAVSLKGETVIPFEQKTHVNMYESDMSTDYHNFAVTADRFLRSEDDDTYGGPFNLFNGSGKLIAKGLRGWPSGMAGEFIVTNEWNDRKTTVYTYTLNGELIASRTSEDGQELGASHLGDYVRVTTESWIYICDREFNIIYELPREYDFEANYYKMSVTGPGVLYDSDTTVLIHRTYRPDGTRLVTWYDPGMNEWERSMGW